MSDTLRKFEREKAMDLALDWMFGQETFPGAASVVQYLEDIGFALVPVTIIGAAGWTPAELHAYQAGVMHERLEKKHTIGFPNVEG